MFVVAANLTLLIVVDLILLVVAGIIMLQEAHRFSHIF
jgi:hypothetical protein